MPDKGVYLGVFKVLSAPTGFKIMVNEHNRVNIPIIFLTESQLSARGEDVDARRAHREEKFNIDLLEGGKPNLGWLGPEMSGEEGATFKEKLDWAIREAKANMNIPDDSTIGKQYDKELIFMDENDNVQLLLYGELAKDPSDCLPGHIWVEKQQFLRENMKYYCPMVLDNMVKEQQKLVNDVLKVAGKASGKPQHGRRRQGPCGEGGGRHQPQGGAQGADAPQVGRPRHHVVRRQDAVVHQGRDGR